MEIIHNIAVDNASKIFSDTSNIIIVDRQNSLIKIIEDEIYLITNKDYNLTIFSPPQKLFLLDPEKIYIPIKMCIPRGLHLIFESPLQFVLKVINNSKYKYYFINEDDETYSRIIYDDIDLNIYFSIDIVKNMVIRKNEPIFKLNFLKNYHCDTSNKLYVILNDNIYNNFDTFL